MRRRSKLKSRRTRARRISQEHQQLGSTLIRSIKLMLRLIRQSLLSTVKTLVGKLMSVNFLKIIKTMGPIAKLKRRRRNWPRLRLILILMRAGKVLSSERKEDKPFHKLCNLSRIGIQTIALPMRSQTMPSQKNST